MHNNRSSHSFLPSLCSLQTFIGLAVILCVYFTLQSSISLNEKSLPSQQIKTVSLRSSFAQPRRIEEEESPPIDEPPPYSYTAKEHTYNTPSSYKEEESPPFDESPPYSYTPKEHIYSTPSISSNKEVESPTIDQSPYSYTPKEHIYNAPSIISNKKEESPSIEQPPPYSYTQEEQSYTSPPISGNEEENLGGLAEYFDISWGDGRGKFHENGSLLTLSLDELSGSGFQSKDEYLFAKIDINIKLISNNSAGTVTTFYMSSNETDHDEIDFEFLGNVSGQPYTVHTNIYSQGKGNREQQFYLWFDPTMDFHSYSILWTPYRIVFFVDGTPIREFENMEKIGVPFPNKQPMRIYSSLWNADDWATQGGRVHTDWSKAPFVASYRNFSSSSCVWSFGTSSCGSDPDSSDLKNAWLMEKLDSKSLEKMRWVQKNYMTYDYCLDKLRFHEGLPKECKYRKSKR